MVYDFYFLFVFVPTVVGFALDLFLGDPVWLPHPVVFMGRLVTFCEKHLYKVKGNLFIRGVFTWIIAALLSAFFPIIVMLLLFILLPAPFNLILTVVSASIMCWNMIAYRGLKEAGESVYGSLSVSLEKARKTVSMFVGRDTADLDEQGVIKAAVETVAENANDGVIAPLFYMVIFGVPGMYLYKAVNTMDSMIGYRNERYELFGKWAARADDFFGFLPARITALLMIAGTVFVPGADTDNSLRIFMRDRNNSSSPNAGQTESVCAGALRIRLGGPASYGGVLYEKKYIGDAVRRPEPGCIKGAVCLLTACTLVFVLFYVFAVLALRRII